MQLPVVIVGLCWHELDLIHAVLPARMLRARPLLGTSMLQRPESHYSRSQYPVASALNMQSSPLCRGFADKRPSAYCHGRRRRRPVPGLGSLLCPGLRAMKELVTTKANSYRLQGTFPTCHVTVGCVAVHLTPTQCEPSQAPKKGDGRGKLDRRQRLLSRSGRSAVAEDPQDAQNAQDAHGDAFEETRNLH